jgi:glycosyltransferase involved in cell wall biosynthesis
MRVRIVVPIHSFEPGGVERVALRLAGKWQTCGEEITVVLGRSTGAAKIEEAEEVGFRTYPSIVDTAPFETIWMIVCLYRYLRREQADILFCPGNTYSIVCAAVRLLLGRRCPPVVAKVSNDLRRADLPAPARLAYRTWVRAHRWFVARFVALAQPMAPEIVEHVGVTPKRVSVIPDPALTTAEFARLATSARRQCPIDGAVIAGVGRLVRQKNFALLLQAFAAHAATGDRLLIAGDGPQLARLRKLAARLGIEERVTFAGHCADVPKLLERADIFALSSDYEGVPAVVVEALAAGVPIVATDCSTSIDWLTGSGRNGIVVSVGDASCFGQALRDIRDMPLPIAEGRQRAAQFTVDQSAASYLALFNAVLRTRALSDRKAKRSLHRGAQFS